jgi:hypothetical protein
MFKHLVGQTAVMRKKGVFKTCDLYEYKGMMFAAFGGGFVRLNANGTSSLDHFELDLLAYDGPLYRDRLGRLAVQFVEGYTQLKVTAEGIVAAPLQLGSAK